MTTRWTVVGVVLLLVGMLAGLAFGSVSLSFSEVLQGARGVGDEITVAIVRDVRMPRLLLAAIVGAGLAMSGAALQGTLRNPLAEPYLLGVSGGAAVGAVLAMAFGGSAPVTVTAAAFLGAVVSTGVVAAVARLAGGRIEPRLLLMAGVIVGAFANAIILVVLADAPPDRVRGALWWMMGSTADATWGSVGRATLAVLVGGAWLLVRGREIDVLSLGEEPAAALGADVDRTARELFLVSSWVAAATVASVGLVGFVGLVVPNLVRAMGATHHRTMLGMATLYGAALLVLADMTARTVRAPIELPLGAVTALIGVPFFLARLRTLQ